MSSISFLISSSKSSEYVTIIIKSKEDLIDPYEENIEGKYTSDYGKISYYIYKVIYHKI